MKKIPKLKKAVKYHLQGKNAASKISRYLLAKIDVATFFIEKIIINSLGERTTIHAF